MYETTKHSVRHSADTVYPSVHAAIHVFRTAKQLQKGVLTFLRQERFMLQFQSGYPPTVDHLRELVIGSLPLTGIDRRILEDCRLKSRCSCNLCPACQGRIAFIQGQHILEAASTIPERRLRVATLTTADVPLDELRTSVSQIMRSTKAMLKALNLAHYAGKAEFSVVPWDGHFHPHVHILASTPPGKGYIKADDWQNEWLTALPRCMRPSSGGAHVKPVRKLAEACGYVAKSPFRYATDDTIGQIVAGIEATKGLRRFATSGAFRAH